MRNGRLFFWALTSALAGFLFGFDTIVISGAEQKIQEIWSLDSLMHGLAMSAALWGTVLGSLVGGWPTEKLGRRTTLIWIGVFYGNFQTAISALTALAQMLLVARLFQRAGLERALFVLPAIVLFGYGTVALLPLLGLLAAVKVLENSTEYSLQNTLQQALFLPTSRDAKYKAKAAIDTFVVRAGDVGSAALVWVGTQLALGVQGFAVVNVCIGVLWLLLIVRLARRHRELSSAHETVANRATGSS